MFRLNKQRSILYAPKKAFSTSVELKPPVKAKTSELSRTFDMGCDRFLGEDITIFKPNHSFGWGMASSLDSEQDANDSMSKCQDVSIDIEEPNGVVALSQLPTLRLSSASTAQTQEDVVTHLGADGGAQARTEECKGEGDFCFIFGARSISKDCRIGEDAHFVTSRALGVADGVSGWSKYGISSCEFSKQIMNNCEDEVNKCTGNIDLFQVLNRAYSRATALGSSTVSMIAINGQTMVGLNLGDSGFLCFTKMDTLYVSNGVSKEQQHDFNTPFQLTHLPMESIPRESELHEIIAQGRLCIDPVSAADRYTLPIHKGDIVVLGTDGNSPHTLGLFDNLFKEDIKTTIRDILRGVSALNSKVAQAIAEELAIKAYKKSKMDIVKTPFQVKYQKELRSSWISGKEDDITVVVGIVKPKN